MNYPYKYIVIVSSEDTYSECESVYKYCDVSDALEMVDSFKDSKDKVALYRISKQVNFNK